MGLGSNSGIRSERHCTFRTYCTGRQMFPLTGREEIVGENIFKCLQNQQNGWLNCMIHFQYAPNYCDRHSTSLWKCGRTPFCWNNVSSEPTYAWDIPPACLHTLSKSHYVWQRMKTRTFLASTELKTRTTSDFFSVFNYFMRTAASSNFLVMLMKSSG
jgi:hypothetical protein